MKSNTNIITIILMLLLFGNVYAQEANVNSDSTRNAERLIKDADRAIGLIVKAGQNTSAEKLQKQNKEAEPFWASVKKS